MDNASVETPGLLPAKLPRIPGELRKNLRRRVMRGDVKGILTQLDAIETAGEEFRPLVRELRSLAKGFQVDALLDLFEKV